MRRVPGEAGEVSSSVVVESLSARFTSELLNAGRSQTTATGYRGLITRLRKWADGRAIELLRATREDLEQWVEELRLSGKKLSSIRTSFTIAREFFRWMVGRNVIERDPFVGIKPVKVPETLQPCMDIPQVDRMAEACQTVREIAIVETFFSSGVRLGGFLKMTLRDLNLDAGRFKIALKGGGEIYGLLQPRAIAALRAWISERASYPVLRRKPTDALWLSRKGALGRKGLADIIHRVAERAGITRCTPHAFRRTFASALTDEGVDIQKVKSLMGHKGIQATEKYTKYSTKGISEAHSRLPRR